MKRLPKLLIVDDDESFQLGLRYFLKGKFDVRSAYNGDEAVAIVKNHSIDILLLDIRMRSEDEGIRYIPKIKEADTEISILISSGVQDFETVREAMRLGAMDYLPKSAEPEDIEYSLSRVLEKKELLRINSAHQTEARKFSKKKQLIGDSQVISNLKNLIAKISKSNANVVITGETGVGKEVVARSLRIIDSEQVLPFVAIDSSTIQSTMAESLLFGHEKGAFTGADQMRKGAFEESNGGIIYFDEIANMPLEIQAKLLRVIQEKEVTRLGSSKAIPLEFRVVCATNKCLEKLVSENKFMEDLYQRLNVIPIQIPPLRDRIEDLELLIDFFTDEHATEERRIFFTDEAMSRLKAYSWPGNIRELNNMIAYLSAVSDEDEIGPDQLPAKVFKSDSEMTPVDPTNFEGKTIYERLAFYEKQILVSEFKAQSGNISRMALSLGMDRSHLYTKLKNYGIHVRKQGRTSMLGKQASA